MSVLEEVTAGAEMRDGRLYIHNRAAFDARVKCLF